MVDIFTKYPWVKPLKDTKIKTVLNAFFEIANEFDRKPNKLLVYQRREFYNTLMQQWLDNNDILMYSKHNEVKLVATERFVKRLKAKHKINDLKGEKIIGSFYEKE